MNNSEKAATLGLSFPDFVTMVRALSRPEAFPFVLPTEQQIPVVQTHASVVLFTPTYVYKLKKPKDFGFFDYSMPMLRRHFCMQEVTLNTRLAPGIYPGVAPVVLSTTGRIAFGPTLPIDQVPMPGALLDEGMVVDYAVVMVRLPDEATLEALVRSGKVTPAQLADVGLYVAAFHSSTPSTERLALFGALAVVRGNWEENFTQMQSYIGRTIEQAAYDCIVAFARRFMQQRTPLFEQRIHDGCIRDCHGDLRLQHVYLLDTLTTPPSAQGLPRIAILDGIEFNERFRYGDVAAEVAFLVMELDAAARYDLARAFVEAYVTATGDDALRELLPFYCCYRACVRGKVLSFLLDEAEVSEEQRVQARQQATELFALAADYTSSPTTPMLLMIGGLMGTGKSTLARILHHELGWALFSSDATRKHLAHLDPTHPQAEAFEQGMYSSSWTARTYQALQAEANVALAQGHSVLLDASFRLRTQRLPMIDQARIHGARAVFIECLCPADRALQRLERRWQDRVHGSQQENASDGRPELYAAQGASWEAFDVREETDCQHIQVSTTHAPMKSYEQVLDALHLPHLCCPLPTSDEEREGMR